MLKAGHIWLRLTHMPNRRAFVQGAIAMAGLPLLKEKDARALAPSSSPSSAEPRLPAAGEDRFLRAASSGDMTTITRMLDEEPHRLYERDVHGQSAYLLAAYGRHPEVMAELEKRGLRLDIYEVCAAAKIDDIKRVLHGAGSQVA